MTREDIKNVNDIIHKTIYGFFDICGDNEEVPMTDKDKLLLEVNKAICNNINALKQTDILDRIMAEIHTPNRGTCDYFIVDRIERIINEYRKGEEV